MSETPISTLNLPMRVFNALMTADIWTIEALQNANYLDLLRLRNFGKVSLRIVHRTLERPGDAMQFQVGTTQAWRQRTDTEWRQKQASELTLLSRIEQLEQRLSDLESRLDRLPTGRSTDPSE